MSEQKYIELVDGTKVPADDFWLYAPTWLIMKYSEPALIPVKKPRRRKTRSVSPADRGTP